MEGRRRETSRRRGSSPTTRRSWARTRGRPLFARSARASSHCAVHGACGAERSGAKHSAVIAERIRQTRSFLAGEGLGPFLVRALAGSGAVRLAAMAGSFAVGVQLARMLGVDGYGSYGLALSILTIVGI